MIEIPFDYKASMEEYHKHCSYHRILLDIYMTHIVELRIIIIREPVSLKCNVYVIDYSSHAMTYKNADEIVCNLEPVGLENAQRIFPDWKFTEETYGF